MNNDLYKAHEWLEKLYTHILLHSRSTKETMEFLNKRQVSKETIRRFGLGFAPSTKFVVRFLQSKGFEISNLIKNKILHRYRDGQIGNLMQGRVVFPLKDHEGRTVGFGGRSLNDEDKIKYINSPNSKIYKKEDNLFGFHLAKEKIKSKDFVILVEGYFDVIISHQYGLNNTVAPLGTALTVNQGLLINSVTNNVIIAFDGDEAGKEASYRSATILRDIGCNVKIANLANYDPDDYIKIYGIKSYLKNIIETSKDVTEDFLDHELDKSNDLCPMNRFSVVKNTLENFSSNNPEEQLKLLSQLSKRLGASLETVQKVVERGWKY